MACVNMHCDPELDNSDSDSLPDLRESLFAPRAMSKGDIVWAKFKKLYWPALVRAIYPKQKKISVWYCDEPGKTFKLPLKNVCRFNDSDMCKKILNDVRVACVRDPDVLTGHEGLTAHANRYLMRRSEGYKDDPSKFFDQTYPFYLAEELLKKDPNADVSNLKIPPMYISHEKKQILRKRINVHNDESGDSEVETTDSESIPEEKKPHDYISDIHMQLQESTHNSIDIDKIVECILSGKADSYLQKIKSKSIPSEHRDLYEQLIQSNKKQDSKSNFTGPIDDSTKITKIILYLLPLYDKMNNAQRYTRSGSKKIKIEVSKTSSFNQRSVGAQYVASVWLPEAIIFAISKIKKISVDEAKELFQKNPESKTKTIENILSCL